MAKNDDIQALATYVAVKHGIKLTDAQHFITELFSLLGEALRNDRMVKVKGLGTFKVIDVKDRESIDVNTGERIVIEGRGKITFTPDTVIKDLVNKPFAQFETVVLNDGVDFSEIDDTDNAVDDDRTVTAIDSDNETEPTTASPVVAKHDAEETPAPEPARTSATQTTADEESSGAETQPSETVAQPEEISEKPAKKANLPATDMRQQETEEAETPVEVTATTSADDNKPTTKNDDTAGIAHNDDEPDDDDDETSEADESDTPNRSYSWIWKSAVCVALVVVAYLVGYNVGKHARQQQMLDEALAQTDTTVATQPDTTATTATAATERELTMSDFNTDSTQVTAEEPAQAQPTAKPEPAAPSYTEPRESDSPRLAQARTMVRLGAYIITGTQETVTVPAGKTLKQLSKYYFGEGMECYILVHNNIDDISEGMQVNIPKLEHKKKSGK